MINFISVTKQFGDQSYGLKDASFQVESGELVLITGPSGSGKTTIMKLLTKEYAPTSGEIEFRGEPLSKIKSGQVHRHRRQIGVVFQDYKLLPEMNVWENIALSLNIIGKTESEIESRVTDLLELIQMTDKAFLFPTQLSGGEAQRVSIARALAAAPAVIFADEPTGNLDPETSVTIARLLHKINELGTTILLATHDQGVVQTLTKHRMIKLDKGQVVDDPGAKIKVAPSTPTPEAESKPEVKPPTKHEPDEPAQKEKQQDEHPAAKPKAEPDQDESKKDESQKEKPPAPAKSSAKPRFSLPKIWSFGKKKPTQKKNQPVRQLATKSDQPFSADFQEVQPDHKESSTKSAKVDVEVENIDSDE